MNKSEKEQVKSWLLKEKSKLETRIQELKELTAPIAPDCAIGRVSRMDAINNRSINEAALQKSRDKQKKINKSGFGTFKILAKIVNILLGDFYIRLKLDIGWSLFIIKKPPT